MSALKVSSEPSKLKKKWVPGEMVSSPWWKSVELWPSIFLPKCRIPVGVECLTRGGYRVHVEYAQLCVETSWILRKGVQTMLSNTTGYKDWGFLRKIKKINFAPENDWTRKLMPVMVTSESAPQELSDEWSCQSQVTTISVSHLWWQKSPLVLKELRKS
jgi:hypothetical protein